MAVCDTCSEHRISRKNLRLSQAQWDAMCEGDERLSGVAVDRWGGAEADAVLPDDLRCCNACYGNRDMLRFGQDDEADDEALFNYDEASGNPRDDESEGGASSYAASRSSKGGARLSSLSEFF